MNTYDENQLEKTAQMIYDRPRTVGELAVVFGKSKRTIKRWLTEMRKRGFRVVREGVGVESPYTIVDPLPQVDTK